MQNALINDSEKKSKGLSLLSAVVFIVGELAGSGVLALPKALAQTGWIGVVLLVIFGINAGFSGVCLAKCWIILEERWEEYRGHVRKPFASIGYRAGGKWMKILCSFCMNITFFGGATVYLLLCSELIHSITHTFIKNLTFCDWIPIMAIILLPLTWLGSPEDFWPAAFGALGATIIGCILLLINIITDSSQKTNDVQYDSPTFQSFFLGLGIITFSFGGAGAFPTFQNDMKDKRKFPLAVSIGFGALVLLYLPVFVTGYKVYGSQVYTNILKSVSDGILSKIIQSLFALHLFLAFLILINPVALEFEDFINIPKRFTWKRCVTRTIVMIAIVFTAQTIPRFEKILSLIGGSTITLMSFVMPPWFYIKLCQQQNHDSKQRSISLHFKVYLIEIVIVGLIGGIASTYSAIIDLFDPSGFTPPCYVNNTYESE